MKKMFLLVAALTVVAGVAAANVKHSPSDEEVEKAIDARLHTMLVKLNSEKK